MRKNSIALLLVLTLSIVAAFAATEDDLNVTTHVTGQNEILVHSIALTKTTWAAPANPITYAISDTEVGSATKVGYINVKTNNRNGYSLAITADPLASGTFEIDYLVAVGSASYDTASATNAANTITVGSGVITGLTVTAYEVDVTVDATQYADAPSGDYSGNIYFNYTATT